MANPTAREQELLELINRMRIAPSAELALLLASSDQGIKDALAFFKVDRSILQSQWNNLTSKAPLAWSSSLNDAALKHNQTMIQYDQQSHHVGLYDATGNLTTAYETDLAGRFDAVNYQYTHGRENIYAYATSIIYAHAGFAIDWGEDAAAKLNGGIQNPAGHRDAMMANDVREVGVSISDENNDKTKAGPLVVTEDFGNRAAIDKKAWLLGVAFQDTNQDGWYQAGEGLKDVQVKVTGINGTNFSDTITVADAGGYQELLDPGQYQVDFIRSGKVVGSGTTKIDPKAPENIKLDLVVPIMTFGVDPLAVTPVTPPIKLGVDPLAVTPVTPPIKLGVDPLAVTPVTPPVTLGSNLQTSGTETKVFDFSRNHDQADAAIAKTQAVAVNFVNVSADAAYHNYAGLYRIEDASGTVLDTDGQTYKPGDAKYLQAALRRSKMTADGTQLDRGDLKGDTTLHGGYMYAPFVVANGKVDDVLNAPATAKTPNVYFNYLAANTDGFEHFKLLGANKLGCEDTFGGGDKDYNDLIFQVSATVV